MTVSVCLFVYSRASLKLGLYILNQISRMLHMSAARSSFGGVAMLYVLPVLWMTHVCT